MESVTIEFKEVVERILTQNLDEEPNKVISSVDINKFIEKLGGTVKVEDMKSDLSTTLVYLQILMFEYLDKK